MYLPTSFCYLLCKSFIFIISIYGYLKKNNVGKQKYYLKRLDFDIVIYMAM